MPMMPEVLTALRMKWLWPLLFLAVIFVLSRFLTLEEPVRYTSHEVYLTRYASITTPGGVYGFAPGTKLTLDPTRRTLPDKVFVTDGTHGMEIEPDALTHDPDRARALAASDQQGQASAAAAVVAEKTHVANAERAAQLSRAHDIEMLNAKQNHVTAPLSTPHPPTPTPTPPLRVGPAIR